MIKRGGMLGELAFFFGMRHVHTARSLQAVKLFELSKHSFDPLMKLFPDEERIIASNALLKFDEAKTHYSKSHAATSVHEGAGGKVEEPEMNEHIFEDMIGDNLAQAIHVLKMRRNNEIVKQMLRAAYRGSIPKIEKLLQQTNINVRDELGRSALHVAASEGKLEVVEYLLKMGADVTAQDSQGFRLETSRSECPRIK